MASNTTSIPENHKRCSKCGEWKPLAEFQADSHKRDGLRCLCRICEKERARRYRLKNLDQERKRDRRRYANNRDKELERHRKWYEKNRDRAREYDHSRYQEKRAELTEYARRFREQNPDKVRDRLRRFRERSRGQLREKNRIYRSKNPDKVREHHRRRRNRKADLPFSFTAIDESRALDYWHGCCAVCGRPLRDLFGDVEPHLDHWIALSDVRCPGTTKDNMIPLCSPCNMSKHNSDPLRWLENRYGKQKAAIIVERIEVFFNMFRGLD